MIITGALTLLTALAFWYASLILSWRDTPEDERRRLTGELYPFRFLFPDSPTSAWFLTPAERAIAVRRLKVRDYQLQTLIRPHTVT